MSVLDPLKEEIKADRKYNFLEKVTENENQRFSFQRVILISIIVFAFMKRMRILITGIFK